MKRSTHHASNITTPLGQQKQDRRPNLLRHTNPPQHILLLPLTCEPPLPRLGTQRRINMPGTNRIHANWGVDAPLPLLGVWIRFRGYRGARKRVPRVSPLGGQRATKLVHRRFGSIVRRCVDAAVRNVA